MKALLNPAQVSMGTITDQASFRSKWMLNDAELDCCQEHFLRNWEEWELAEQLTYTDQVVINVWGRKYKPVFTGPKKVWDELVYKAMNAKRDYSIHDRQPKFWLSFRAGIDFSGQEFAYVIIQQAKPEKLGRN